MELFSNIQSLASSIPLKKTTVDGDGYWTEFGLYEEVSHEKFVEQICILYIDCTLFDSIEDVRNVIRAFAKALKVESYDYETLRVVLISDGSNREYEFDLERMDLEGVEMCEGLLEGDLTGYQPVFSHFSTNLLYSDIKLRIVLTRQTLPENYCREYDFYEVPSIYIVLTEDYTQDEITRDDCSYDPVAINISSGEFDAQVKRYLQI